MSECPAGCGGPVLQVGDSDLLFECLTEMEKCRVRLFVDGTKEQLRSFSQMKADELGLSADDILP